MRGADCNSDHFLARVKVKARLKRRIATKPTIVDRYDISEFKDEECCKCFKSEIHKHSKDLDIDRAGSINSMRKKIQDTTKKKRQLQSWVNQKIIKNPWFNEKCEKFLNRRKIMFNLNDLFHERNKIKYN